ncbi:anaerobic ribonucleoside-triphosphate reductase activating protein [Corynebacterium freiburgense]|uniref:anaerobic ribonucleoside-triphosphate reductase activating protein n=1 Tax=Corynebacterium freiburgense TaxID=556548 RepID=UPI0003F90B29|nr:anaerobic ribonucleoside-triphosphate reductase activating protein [Corynebacterium freiburgense]WJZ03225.1 pyrroloquinoline quinone biosynthesis protein PqqE [Corynebacterium freiburgense]
MSANTLPNQQPDIIFAGLLPFSSTDWPDKLTATVFTQGCPLDCRYCHNPALKHIGQSGNVTLEEIETLLVQRKGLLDGLVISGGEPLLHRGLSQTIARVHALGFPVGLHTSGYSPKRLAKLLAHNESRPDWIGLDVKGLPEDLPEITGCTVSIARRMWESLEIVAKSGIDIQVRTTVWPNSPVSHALETMQAKVTALGLPPLAIQVARNVDRWGYYIES